MSADERDRGATGRIDLEALRSSLSSRRRRTCSLPAFRPAAVLVPLVDEDVAPQRLLFTVRRSDLPSHAGQISFPGGKAEDGDDGPAGTARREAFEEVGLRPEGVEVLGLLDDVPTPSGFIITPVVARVRGPLALVPDPREVAEAFYADVETLRRIGTLAAEREWLGVRWQMVEYTVGGRFIWGATAGIVYQLLRLTEAG